MGIAYYNTPNQIEIGGEMWSIRTLSTPAANLTLSTFDASWLSAITGTIHAAYLDVVIRKARDTSGAFNQNNSATYIQIKSTTTGAYTNAILMSSGILNCEANQSIFPGRYYGQIDIKSTVQYAIANGEGLSTRWENALAVANGIQITDIQVILKILTRS